MLFFEPLDYVETFVSHIGSDCFCNTSKRSIFKHCCWSAYRWTNGMKRGTFSFNMCQILPNWDCWWKSLSMEAFNIIIFVNVFVFRILNAFVSGPISTLTHSGIEQKFSWCYENRSFPSSLESLFQNESKCETFHMKMSSARSFIFMQIEVIFIRMVSHLDSLWNRGTRELGNGLFKRYRPYQTYFIGTAWD